MVVSYQGDYRSQESDNVTKDSINGGDSCCSINGGLVVITKQEEMTELAAQKHALSERNRRKRINDHYDSLRQFFPKLIKSDKASVLSETVRHIKELEKLLADLEASTTSFIPGGADQVSVDATDNTTIRAIICCEDWPELNHDLMEAIRSVGGKVVKANMATVGGRTLVDVVVELLKCEGVGLLRRALKAVVENLVLGGNGSAGPHVLNYV